MTWQSTAKRLAEHPKWEWREGMLIQWDEFKTESGGIIDAGQDRIVDDPWPDGWKKGLYWPVLTDWATVGVLLGMCIEAGCFIEGQTDELVVQRLDGKWGINSLGWDGSGLYLERDLADKENLGQALAELLLELWGEG